MQAGDVLLLDGDLGAGKTSFTKGLAKGLGITDYVKSPTFTIVREYRHGRLPCIIWICIALKTVGLRISVLKSTEGVWGVCRNAGILGLSEPETHSMIHFKKMILKIQRGILEFVPFGQHYARIYRKPMIGKHVKNICAFFDLVCKSGAEQRKGVCYEIGAKLLLCGKHIGP